MRKISFVIPCYGSENTIIDVVNEIIDTVEKREENEYEIILVNDCSPDKVWEKIKQLCTRNQCIKGICLSKNFGQHSALMAGYRQTTGDIVISLDDDGQTPANELYSLVDELDKGYDVVYATYENKQHSGFRNWGSKINDYMCVKLLNKPKNLMVTSYFVAKRFVIDEMCKYENSYTYVIGLVFRTTKNIGAVSVKHRKRVEGNSGYTFGKLLGLWANGFTAFSVKPLRIATITGVFFAFVGCIFVIYIIVNKFINPNVPLGWSSTTAAVLVVGGAILCMLGMLGEYLGRVYISLNNSPQYVIKEIYQKNIETEK